jgi:hypothetical protein
MYEVSHPKKDGKKNLNCSEKVCARNSIDIRKKWLIILRRLRKTSNT